MSIFEQLQQNREAGLQKLLEATEDSKDKYTDDRFWYPGVDKVGNGFAIIRFLPDPNAKQWVTYYEHGFQGSTGKWYIEKSRTTLDNQPDPVSEMNTKLWNSGSDDDKELARKRKRKVNNVSNIFVVSDPANPDNEGKVFLYRFGVKIKSKIVDVANPKFQDETPLNPFDMWGGANFKIKICDVAGYRNYDRSEFDAISPLLDGNNDALEKVFDQVHNLAEFIDPANYKSYNTLKARLNEVLGEASVESDYNEDAKRETASPPPTVSDDLPYGNREIKDGGTQAVESSGASTEQTSGDEEALSFFAKLAEKE